MPPPAVLSLLVRLPSCLCGGCSCRDVLHGSLSWAWCLLGCSRPSLKASPGGRVIQKWKVRWKWSVESHQRKGDVEEVDRRVDVVFVVSVMICMRRCCAIVGKWSGTEEPQLYPFIVSLAHSVAWSNLLSIFPIGKSRK